MKKRNKYATVIIDIETRKIVDILESRDYEEVKRWLSSFPNLELISRDGSIVYNKAIKDAHPKSIQVSDRFHILKNLTDYCKQYIKRIFKNKIEIGKLENINSGETLYLKEKYKFKTKWDLILKVKELRDLKYKVNDIASILGMSNKTVIAYSKISNEDKEKYDKITNAEAKSSDISKSKEYLINKVKELSSEGKSMRKIAEEMVLDRKTVKKYLESDENWNHTSKGVKKKSKLDNYKNLVKKFYIDGISSKEIYKKIKAKGYTGSESLIRKFITDFRSETIEENEAVDIRYVETNDLISLLYKPIEKVETITLEEFEVVLDRYEKYKIIFNIVEEFKEILFGKDSTKLNTWITKSKALGIKELNSFITGITRDIEAVENAINYEYSNGLAEGKINKIKVIKRIMYGRCTFEILRNRVLQIEYNT
ncbi:transposase [Sporanaerobacter acetigenes]|uniref:transposase n=1 Tax=Sporanaerobacter acetigenes TaxID=165813 RepID=UPI00331CD215